MKYAGQGGTHMEVGTEPNTVEEAIVEVTTWAIITALHNPALLAKKGEFLKQVDGEEVVAKLVSLGCEKELLLNTLVFAAWLPEFYPPLIAADLNRLADDTERLLREMKRLTPSIALPWIEESDDGYQELVWKPTGADLHVWPWLERELLGKVSLYRQLATMCTLRQVPTKATIGRIAGIWPVAYVNSCTGEPHYALVSKLLDCTPEGKNPKQLRVAFLSVSEEYPHLERWLVLATRALQQAVCFVGPFSVDFGTEPSTQLKVGVYRVGRASRIVL
jgi:hypothetical protein